MIRHAGSLAVVWVGLVVIDIATGSGFWAQWPGIAFLAVIGMEAAPLVSRNSQTVMLARAAVTITVLALINLFSWSGDAWFLWPAGAIIIAALIRKVSVRTQDT